MKNLLLITIAIFFAACGTERQYFTPAYTNGDVKNIKNLKSKIIDWNLYSAKLNNNDAIYEDFLNTKFKLEKNYILLNYQENEFLISDNNGNFKIVNSENKELYSENFKAVVVSASMDGDDIALVLSNNTIVYANKLLGIKYSKQLASAPAQDNRVAFPIFLKDTIIYPTLDGRLVTIKKDNYEIIKDYIVSGEPFFNNVIFLNMINDNLLVATQNKLSIIKDNKKYQYKANISNVVANKDYIFILEKDGNIIKTDFNLKKIDSIKFDFAIYTKASLYKDSIYIFEKTGYLIKINLNFENIKVFKLQQAASEMSFMQNDYFYYSSKFIKLDEIK